VIYAVDANLLEDNNNTIKKNTGAPIHTGRLVDLEAGTEKLSTC
jgi:hypothetical protein